MQSTYILYYQSYLIHFVFCDIFIFFFFEENQFFF